MKNAEFNTIDEQKYISKFLFYVGQTPKFDFTLDFMEDGDREKIRYVIENLDKIDS